MNTVDKAEIELFEAISQDWWDPNGPLKPLHKLNPERIRYIRQQIESHFRLKQDMERPFEKLSILDIGCGGGLVCEAMSRLGGKVTGIDAAAKNINIAIEHAELSGLDIEYLPLSSEQLLGKGTQYDVVLALEIIEHVSDIQSFVEHCTKLVKPGGLVIFSTLNRTPESFALGIVAAEHLLRWVPKGTHSWQKFLKPSEIARLLRTNGFKAKDVTGLCYQPFKDSFKLNKKDLKVNYFLSATKQD